MRCLHYTPSGSGLIASPGSGRPLPNLGATPARNLLLRRQLVLTFRATKMWNTIANLVMAAATVALAIIGGVALRAAIRTLRAAQLSVDALVASERGWIMVDIKPIPAFETVAEGVGTGGVPIISAHVRCICTNAGKTPAKIVQKRARIVMCNLQGGSLPEVPDLDIDYMDQNPHALSSGQSSTHQWDVFGEGHKGDVGKACVLYGVVRYRHMFSEQEVQTTFAYMITGQNDLLPLPGYPEYNKFT
jgi:hypothetical protein